MAQKNEKENLQHLSLWGARQKQLEQLAPTDPKKNVRSARPVLSTTNRDLNRSSTTDCFTIHTVHGVNGVLRAKPKENVTKSVDVSPTSP